MVCEILAGGLSVGEAVLSSLWKGEGRSGSRHLCVVHRTGRDVVGSGRGSEVCNFLVLANISMQDLVSCDVFGLAGAHNPIAVIAGSNTSAGLLKLEILQQFYTICIFWILLQAPPPLAREPFW